MNILSDYIWMFVKSKSFEYTVDYFIVVHPFYTSYLFQSMMMAINISISHINIKQWWWSMCLYLIYISSNDDDLCVQILYHFHAMMMINVSISHIHNKQWSMCLYLISISSNDHLLFLILSEDSEDIYYNWTIILPEELARHQRWSLKRWCNR